MNSSFDFYLMARTYDCYGGHSTFSLIAPFLLEEAPDFGSGLVELSVTLHFPTRGPARSTLEGIYAAFHANRQTLPKVVFRRARQRASIDVASELIDGSEWQPGPGLSVPLFKAGVDETISAARLLAQRLKATDDFNLESFLRHLERRRTMVPSTEAELILFRKQAEEKKAAARAAMSPWDRLGIDWRDFHPDARTVLDEPWFWEQANDFSPHGNDTGADLLADYRAWLKRHPNVDPVDFYRKLVRDWGLPEDEDAVLDEAAVALAFAEIKLTGTCRSSAAELALKAVQRQRVEALGATDWPHRDDRLKCLEAIEAKLRSVA